MCVCFSIYGLLYFVISRHDPDNISLLSCVTLTFLKHLLVCLAVLVISSLASSCASVHISRIICIYPLLLTLYMWLLCGSDHLSPPACRIRGLSYYNSELHAWRVLNVQVVIIASPLSYVFADKLPCARLHVIHPSLATLV